MPETDYQDLSEYKRVLQLADNPTEDELQLRILATSASLALFGLFGLVVYGIMSVIPQ